MIYPNTTASPVEVGAHYDDLDRYYREIWGEHVHHGYWKTGRESQSDAVLELTRLVADEARVASFPEGARVADVGCGYGGTSRFLAEEHKSHVTAFSVSAAQLAYAQTKPAPSQGSVEYRLQDWQSNDLADGSFDAVIAIESSEHMADKERFFSEAYRTLRPGGRLVVCAWIARETPRPWEHRHLLEPICREGRLPSMGDEGDYERLIRGAGFELLKQQDLSSSVKRTWPLCAAGALKRVFIEPEKSWQFLRKGGSNRVFAKTLFRIWAAYEFGAMRYIVFTAQRPQRQ